jgi:SAM-dependent methyltransferase
VPHWDERYAEPDYAYGTEPNDFLRSVAPALSPGRVLCLAEGQGRNAVFLAGLGHDVTAVDQSDVGLGRARQLAAARGVHITTVQADLAAYAIEEASWDAVVAIFAHLPVPVRRLAFGRAVAGLRPGAVFILEAYAPRQLALGTGGPRQADLLMDVASLREDLPGLVFEVAREVQRDVTEGRYHTGLAAVVQLVGRKSAPPGHPG